MYLINIAHGGRQGPVMAKTITYTRSINLDTEIASIDSAIPVTYTEVVAGSGTDGRLQTAIDTTLAAGGHVHIIPDGGDYDALFDADVSIHGKIKITAADGITIKPSGSFAYNGIFFDNKTRGGTWAESGSEPFGSELDPHQPQSGSYGWYYDANIILEDLVVDCGRSAARVTRFVGANKVIYRNCDFSESGQAIIADQGIQDRYVIGCDITDSGRGGSTHEPYNGSVTYSKPPRAMGNCHWLYNTITDCGDDSIGCVATGRIEEEGADSDCWFDKTYWYEGYHPICVIAGNVISGTTQANGIKISFVPGMSLDVVVDGNTISGVAYAGIHIKNAVTINEGSCTPYGHVPEGVIRVDVKNNDILDYGVAWNDGMGYWVDSGGYYSFSQVTTCTEERALGDSGRGVGYYSAIYVNSPYAMAGDVAISDNDFTSGVGPALCNETGRIKEGSGNTYTGFVHDPQDCGVADGTIPEVADIQVSENFIKSDADKDWTLSYTYTP